jgi:four helix bundle protein
MQLAEDVYGLTQQFPNEERYGLTSQLRRAAISIPANIAEGNSRSTTKDYLRFLTMAVGSLAEMETFLELTKRFNYGTPNKIDDILSYVAEERRMLNGLQRSLRAKL